MKFDCGSILIVDDDAPYRQMLALLFNRAGYMAAEAANADEAFAVAGRERPAAVLLDVQLEGTSGYAICRELREQFGEQLPPSLCANVDFAEAQLNGPGENRCAGLPG